MEKVGHLVEQPGEQAVVGRKRHKDAPQQSVLGREGVPCSFHSRAPGKEAFRACLPKPTERASA
eukprot:9601558-Lingulodinium_polyedra.AAC.1